MNENLKTKRIDRRFCFFSESIKRWQLKILQNIFYSAENDLRNNFGMKEKEKYRKSMIKWAMEKKKQRIIMKKYSCYRFKFN
jgi:hypothetical protein